MSRNKTILLIVALVALYVLLPTSGVAGIIKANMQALAPYVLLFIIVYLLVTINMLKRALTKLNNKINDANTINVSKLMNITFDIKRFMGEGNMIELYNRVNFAKNVSVHAKTLFYKSMKKKRMSVPVPATNKSETGSNFNNALRGKPNPNKKRK